MAQETMDSLEEEARSQGQCLECDCDQDGGHHDDPGCASQDVERQYLPESNVIVHVNDHGNITVMDMDRNELWSCV